MKDLDFLTDEDRAVYERMKELLSRRPELLNSMSPIDRAIFGEMAKARQGTPCPANNPK